MTREPCNCGVCIRRRKEAEAEATNLKAAGYDDGGLYGTDEKTPAPAEFVYSKAGGYTLADNMRINPENLNPTRTQVGGDHYSHFVIQPSEFILKNKLGWLEGNVIKYVCRHPFKNGIEDIRKAIHYLQLILKWVYNTNA
jgi:hypothetical protein